MAENGQDGCASQPDLDGAAAPEASSSSLDTNQTSDQNSDSSDRRSLFIGGIHPETTEIDLRLHYCQFGDIEYVNLKMNHLMGKTKGFAFIKYSTVEAADNALAYSDHIINDKKVVTMRLKHRNIKLFVTGLTDEITDNSIRNYFYRFGSLVEIQLVYNKATNIRNPFAFVTYSSANIANRILKIPRHVVNGIQIFVKKARNTARETRSMDFRDDRSTGCGAYGYAPPAMGYTFNPYLMTGVPVVADNMYGGYQLPAVHSHGPGYNIWNHNQHYYSIYNYIEEPELGYPNGEPDFEF